MSLIKELHNKQIIKNDNKQKCYNTILNKCYNRIRFISDKSQSCCFFEIPEFVFGIPLFNSTECVKFIVKKLIDDGFLVIYTHPNLLYISWDIEFTSKSISNNKHKNQALKDNNNNFKLISDYKPSGKFLEKLNL